jgi:hypothetical protein
VSSGSGTDTLCSKYIEMFHLELLCGTSHTLLNHLEVGVNYESSSMPFNAAICGDFALVQLGQSWTGQSFLLLELPTLVRRYFVVARYGVSSWRDYTLMFSLMLCILC